MRVLTFRFPFISGQIMDKKVGVGVRIHTMYSVWVIICGALGEIGGVHDNQPMRQREVGTLVSEGCYIDTQEQDQLQQQQQEQQQNNNFQHSNK
jgi:hypothetical protein